MMLIEKNQSSVKSISGILNQSGDAEPTLSGVVNSLGAVNLVRNDVGAFAFTSAALFTTGKTSVLFQTRQRSVTMDWDCNESNINFTLYEDGIANDGLLDQTYFEIKVVD